jgi:hypothetical protein
MHHPQGFKLPWMEVSFDDNIKIDIAVSVPPAVGEGTAKIHPKEVPLQHGSNALHQRL